jgi:hypothetical protein
MSRGKCHDVGGISASGRCHLRERQAPPTPTRQIGTTARTIDHAACSAATTGELGSQVASRCEGRPSGAARRHTGVAGQPLPTTMARPLYREVASRLLPMIERASRAPLALSSGGHEGARAGSPDRPELRRWRLERSEEPTSKLKVQVRFPSPALTRSPQVRFQLSTGRPAFEMISASLLGHSRTIPGP